MQTVEPKYCQQTPTNLNLPEDYYYVLEFKTASQDDHTAHSFDINDFHIITHGLPSKMDSVQLNKLTLQRL